MRTPESMKGIGHWASDLVVMFLILGLRQADIRINSTVFIVMIG